MFVFYARFVPRHDGMIDIEFPSLCNHSCISRPEKLQKTAKECLADIIHERLRKGWPWPKENKGIRDTNPIYLDSLPLMKLILLQTMREQNLRARDLAERLNIEETIIARLLDHKKHSKIEHVERLLQSLGKKSALDDLKDHC